MFLFSKLQFKKLSVEVPVLFRVVELPQKHHLCKVKSLNKGDANSEVTVYYQVTQFLPPPTIYFIGLAEDNKSSHT